MASLAVTYTFVNDTIASATEVNTNYTDIVNYVNTRNSGSATWDNVSATSSSATPLIVDNSTGTNDIASFRDNTTQVLAVGDGGQTTITANGGTNVALTVNGGTSTGNALKVKDNGTDVLIVADGGQSTLTANGGSNVALTVNNGTSTGDIVVFKDNGTTILSIQDGGAMVAAQLAPSSPVANALYKDNIIKAWINYNGSTATINGQFNVPTVTKNGTGDYTCNFATSMANTTYCPVVSLITAGAAQNLFSTVTALATGSVRVKIIDDGLTPTDLSIALIVVGLE